MKKSTIRFTSTVLMVMFLIPLMPRTAIAESYSDWTFTVTDEKATITGYFGTLADPTIPSTLGGYPVTAIGDNAFNDLATLTDVTIPEGVMSIGMAAFWWCKSLAHVTLPDSLTHIGVAAFWACSSLTQVTLPDGLTSIEQGAFEDSGLTQVTLPDSLTQLGPGAFMSGKLTSIDVDAGNPDFASKDGVLFDKSMTTLIEYPGGREGFYWIPDSVTTIGPEAFADCQLLRPVSCPDSVKIIEGDAFGKGMTLDSNIILFVGPNSNAMQFAINNNIHYVVGSLPTPTPSPTATPTVTEVAPTPTPEAGSPTSGPSAQPIVIVAFIAAAAIIFAVYIRSPRSRSKRK